MKNGTIIGYAYTNHVIARTGFTLRGPLGHWRFSEHLPAKYKGRPKKVLPSHHRAPTTVPYGKFGPSYCITFIKRLDEDLS